MVTFGIVGMFLGYLLLALPLGSGLAAWISMAAGLLVICMGTGLFKGNLQVMVGNLYDDPAYSAKRDSAFSIFYMAINLGALFAPTAAVEIMNYAQTTGSQRKRVLPLRLWRGMLLAHRLHAHLLRFPLHLPPCGRHHKTSGSQPKETAHTEELTPKETKDRIVALCLVFAVVIFFWMAFHQTA